jgi:cytochrome P450
MSKAFTPKAVAAMRPSIERLTRERDAARAAIRDASRCEDCGAWATRYHSASARFSSALNFPTRCR